jgi:superfamily II DNA/RNA helicase
VDLDRRAHPTDHERSLAALPQTRTSQRPTIPGPTTPSPAPAPGVQPLTSLTFADLGLPAALVAALADRGIAAPFPIQARAIPDALAGSDVLGRGETGSGKTLAFGLPLLSRIAAAPGRRRPSRPRGLVLVPTRELARQVDAELRPFAPALGLRVTAVYGGAPIPRQMQALRHGVDVVVATPGRLEDLISRRACALDAVVAAVVDEADHMCDLGFLPSLIRLLDQVPAAAQRSLFSATLDHQVDAIVRRYLTSPVRHEVTPVSFAPVGMDHHFLAVAAADKTAIAAELSSGNGRTLLFVRTKHGADRLARQLGKAGVPAGAIHGNLPQSRRERALAEFADGTVPVLVATDVAARGIHVDGVDRVVHFDPPAEHKTYLHRSGRTARAGAAGAVVSLVVPDQKRAVSKMAELAGVAAGFRRAGLGDSTVRALAANGETLHVRRDLPAPAQAPAQAPARPRAGEPRRDGRAQGRRRQAVAGRPARAGRRDRGAHHPRAHGAR